MPEPERWILHADMDAFYASVEQRERPELRGKPVIVGAHSARGVVSAASYEAREYGVRSAMPGFRARELCPDGVFLPGRMDLYVRVSGEVHRIFEEFTDTIQPLALDEAFLDVGGSMHLFAGPEQLGAQLKARVAERTQLDISVGLASSKLVAKIACTLSKPNGLKVVPRGSERALLAPLPIRRLWGVGPVAAQRLAGWNIHTVGDLADYDERQLFRLAGERGLQLQRWARGRDDSPVVSERVAKSCGEENTFASDVSEREQVSAAITSHSETVAARLRAMRLRGRTVTLKIKLARRRGGKVPRVGSMLDDEPDYPVLSRSKTLPSPTDDAKQIRDVALKLWDASALGEPIRLIGVTLSNLQPADAPRQLELFGEQRKADELGPTLDAIVRRFGKGAIRRAVDEPEKTTLSLTRKVPPGS